MKDDEVRELVRYRLEQAQVALEDARSPRVDYGAVRAEGAGSRGTEKLLREEAILGEDLVAWFARREAG